MSNPDSFAHTHSAGHVIGGGRYSLHVTLGETDLLWLAQDELEQRLAVVRFFPAELYSDQRAWNVIRRRFAELLKVNHPAISKALEWYEADGVEPFVAFEYMEGQGLAPRSTPMPWDKLQPVAVDIATAIAALHSHGVVHHGLEPANIIITESGARLVNPVIKGVLKDALLCPSALQRPLEMRWFSPQQLAGEEPAPADDFYSFGATLFELVTGTSLFANSRTLASDLRNGPPSDVMERLAGVRGLPPSVAEFILACLCKDAAQRPTIFPARLQAPAGTPERLETPPLEEPVTDPVVVSSALEILPETSVCTLGEPMRRRRKSPALIAVVMLLCGMVGSAAWFVNHSQAEKQRLAAARDEKAREAERLRQLTDEQRLHAAMLVEKKQQESVARQRAEAELKRRELESAQMAAAESERRSVHASVEVQPVSQVTTKTPGLQPLAFSTKADGFVSLFNGRDLSGWNGDSNLWSVIDGYITAQAPANAPTHKRSYLVWKDGSVQDFELQFSYRFRLLRGNKQPNGGVLYRATTNNTPELYAYQFDVVTDARNAGAINEDKKRYRLCGFGESAVAGANEKTRVAGQLGDTNILNATRPEDWNTGVIVARGNHLTHYMNGEVVADLVDENVKRFHKSGMLALELHSKNTNNPATFLQFKDIKLKRLEKAQSLLSSTGAVTR